MALWRAPTHPRRSAASSEVSEWRSRLGRKVSIRYRLHGDEAHPFSEAIGVVQSISGDRGDQRVEIMTRRGEVASVAVADILAAKVFD